MRKISVLLLLGLLCLPALTNAEEGYLKTTPTAAEREAKMNEVKAKLEKEKANLDAKRGEAQEKRADRIKNYVDQVTQRLNQVITRLDEISARVDTYLTQAEGKGANTADARTKQKSFQDALLAAKGAITALPSQIGTPANPEKLTTAEAKKIRAAVKVAVDSVKAATKSFQELIKAVRAVRLSLNPNPSPAETDKSRMDSVSDKAEQ